MTDSRKLFQNGKVFETFVISVLRQMAADQGVPIHFDAPLNGNASSDQANAIHYDAIAPEGFDNYRCPVVFTFKYFGQAETAPTALTQLEHDLRTLVNKHQIYHGNDTRTALVLVSSRYYPKEYMRDIRSIKGIPVVVWDGYTIESWCEDYPVNYSNAIGIDKVASDSFPADINVSDFLDKSKSNIRILQEIVKTDSKFALVLGAGISVDPGALLWDDLLGRMQTDLTTNRIIDNSNQVCKKIGDNSLITAQLCRDLYKDERSFCWAIHEGLYNGRKPINPSYSIYEVARIIDACKGKRHFRVLTYNFDDYLEEYLNNQAIAHNILYSDTSPVDDRVSIYHVHGFLPQVKVKSHLQARHMRSIFLTEENYNDLYNHPYSWQISSQLSFFRENVCLFVGCSLADPNLRRLLEMTKADNKTHFAIIRNDLATIKDLTVTTTHFARLGVEVIWVNTFGEITNVLRSLH